jgi:hypothetical protein
LHNKPEQIQHMKNAPKTLEKNVIFFT